ncbi:MAG: cell division protein ZapA [Arsenophonus sp. NC-WZS1-MAG3]
MSTQPVDIQILGRTLRVNCPKEQENALKCSAAELEKRLKDLRNRTGVTNTEQLIFIVALNICHELMQEKTKTQDYTHNMEQKIRVLQHTIEQALQEQARITSQTITPLE